MIARMFSGNGVGELLIHEPVPELRIPIRRPLQVQMVMEPTLTKLAYPVKVFRRVASPEAPTYYDYVLDRDEDL